jgi:putative DNA primase/helicase
MTTDIDAASNGHAGPGAQDRVLDALGRPFSLQSLKILQDAAISPENARRFGITAVAEPEHIPDEIYGPWNGFLGEAERGMIFTWKDLDRDIPQYRPDEAITTPDGKTHKYLAPKESGTFLNHLRTPRNSDDPYLFVEGSKQGVSAAAWAPEGWGVVAVPGCNNWIGTDLTWADGRRVIILFDADFTSNRGVYDAAAGLKDALEVEGADEIVFAKLAGAKDKEGLDDVLGRRPKDKRTSYIQRISDLATTKLGRAPNRKSNSKYFNDQGKFLARTTALAALDSQPAALAAGSMIALYRNGAFRIDVGKEPLFEKVKDLLGEDYRPQWRQTIEEFLIGELSGRGLRVGGKATEPLLNTASCMIDLRTGEMLPHDPKYLSTVQIPVGWDPDAVCPTYEAWLYDVIPGQAEALEEIASTMLDPSRTPLKQAFLFGPTHSGKSTFLRIMMEIAGKLNTSAVGLHQLVEDRFMAAELYGKMLNSASEVPAAHIEDVSLFKRLTGEDPIQANRKYGKTFTFTNRALFAFSANEVPTVSETSRAYVQRIAPFKFDRSFAGNEKPEIEERMIREELPGILRRWVGAWRKFSERGLYLPSDLDAQKEFETSSDRVARWVALRCDVHPEAVGRMVGPEAGDSVSSLYTAFKIWARDDSPANVMSRPKFSERLRSIPGVGDVRLSHRNKNAGLNVTTHIGEDREIVTVRATNTDNPDKEPTPGANQDSANVPVSTGNSPVSSDVRGVGSDPHSLVKGIGGTECVIQKDDLGRIESTESSPRGYQENPKCPTPPHTSETSDSESDETGTSPIETRTDQDTGGEAPSGTLPPIGESEDVPTLPTPAGQKVRPAEEYLPDPFADHEPPAPSVPVGLDLEAWDADDLFRHEPVVLGPYVRLVGTGPMDDVATGRAEVLERISGPNTIVGVNLALFDLPALDVHEGIPVEQTIPRAHDIRFVAFQADPPTSWETKAGPHFKRYNLESLCQRHLGDHKSDLGKKLADEYGGWGHIRYSDPRYHEYCKDDVIKALRLAEVLPLTDYDRREMEVAAITARATIEGFRVDVPALERRITEQAAELAKGRTMLHEQYGFPTHTKDGKSVSKAPQRTAAGKIAFENALKAMGFPLDQWDRGKDGTLSLGKELMSEALEYAEAEGMADAALIIRSVQDMNGLRSNAANIMRCTMGDRVHPKFEPFQAFGRWSVTEPGVTVLKKSYEDSDRIYMLPDPGHVLVSFDADQVDIRCVAFHSQDPGLLAIMQDPARDIHNEISDLAFGRHDDPYRFHAKSCDLGWLYGRSVNGLAGTPGITFEAAQRVDETMRRQFGQVVDWQHEVRIRAEGRALLDNGFGRHFRCDEGREYTQAPAGHGQSMTRDVVAEGLLTMKRNHPELIPMLRVIVHDEIVMSIPEADVEDVKRMVISDMTIEKGGVPFTWGASRSGHNWGECYRKD